jgi:hypothetical protein
VRCFPSHCGRAATKAPRPQPAGHGRGLGTAGAWHHQDFAELMVTSPNNTKTSRLSFAASRTRRLPQTPTLERGCHGLLGISRATPASGAERRGWGPTLAAVDDDRDDGRAVRGRRRTSCSVPHRPLPPIALRIDSQGRPLDTARWASEHEGSTSGWCRKLKADRAARRK